MQKRFLLTLSLVILTSLSYAQNPKWFKKALKAQVNVFTFDADGNLLRSGNGFYIDESGTALANFILFKGASSAKVIDTNGKEHPVSLILGANSLYDVVKFKVDTQKKTTPLQIAERAGVKHEQVYIMPYSTSERKQCLNDSLFNIQTFGEDFHYYTLGRNLSEKYVNCPVMTEEGEVLAMIQQPATENTSSQSYAIGVTYGTSLRIGGLSASDNDLNAINICKALPTDESEATTFVYMAAASSDSATYQNYLNAFARQFPQNPNAYTQLADFHMAHQNYAQAEANITSGLDATDKKAEIYYAFSKMLYQLNLQPNYKLYKDWDMKKALQMAEEAYKEDALPLYKFQAGLIGYALKEYEKAYNDFIMLTTTNMRSADLFLYAAQCKTMLQADTTEILALQDSAVACFSKPYVKDAAPSLMARANTLLLLGRYREAVADLNEYEHLMSAEITDKFYYLREQAEIKGRMFQQAIDDIDRAIRMSPKESLYHAERGSIFYRVGELDEAIKSCQKAIELAPNYMDAYRILGICQLAKKERSKGLQNLQKAADLGDSIAKDIIKKEGAE